MSEPQELPDPVSGVLSDTVDEARINRIWAGMESRPTARRRPVVWVVPVLAAAAALVLVWAWPRDAPALTLASGAELVEIRSGGTSRTVALADGSSVRLGPNTVLDPTENDGDHIRWRLAEGEARFEVRPHGPRRWVVDGGEAMATVLGTVFTVRRAPGWTEVEVERGRVRVDGVDGSWTLTRGQSREVGRRVPETVSEAAAPEPESGTSPATPLRVAQESEPTPAPRPARIPTPPAETASALLDAADAARQEGRTEEAVALLRRASAFEDADAALAAFTLGRVLAPRDPSAAAQAFERALVLPLPVRLAEDASARRVEAWAEAGDEAATQRAARAYLVRYPDGRHASRVRAHVAGP
ncbi:MAG: FecR domain-containing protein [Sandaracinaceae bacterium]